MKTSIFSKRSIRSALIAVPLLAAGALANAQGGANVAPAATMTPFTAGADGLGTKAVWSVNDQYIPQYPGGEFTAKASEQIEFVWPEKQTFNKIVIYKGESALTDAQIEYDDGTGYKSLLTYSNRTNMEVDSVSFTPVSAVKLRLTKLTSNAKGRPAEFREIEIKHDQTVSGIACPGTVNGGTVTPLEQTLCLGAQATIVAGGYSFASNIAYQWQVNDGSGWKDVSGATNTWLSFRVTEKTPTRAEYRLKVVCGGTTVYSKTSGMVEVKNGNKAQYASIPFLEDFENDWKDGCTTADVPSVHWTSTASTDNSIWARSDAFHPGKEPFPDAPSGKFSARFKSREQATQGAYAHLDLHVDCSSLLGDKTLFFYYVNSSLNAWAESEGKPESAGPLGNDVLSVWMSKDGGKTFEALAAFYQEDKWAQKSVTIPSNSKETIIRFTARTSIAPKEGRIEGSDIGIDRVSIEPPCSGAVTAGQIAEKGPIKICAGEKTSLTGEGYTLLGGIKFQWEQSASANGPWTSVTSGSGGTTPSFTTPALFGSRYYRLRITCSNGGDTKTTQPVQVEVGSAPVYAKLPFMESFESWIDACGVENAVPSKHWVSTPTQGTNAWRRYDQANDVWGANYVWNPSTGQSDKFDDYKASEGKYFPEAFHGDHSARFHTVNNRGGIGTLDLFLDCSTHSGEKELSFALNLTKDIPPSNNNPNPAPNGYDYLNVYVSTDGGDNFTLLQKIAGPAFSTWEIKSMPLVSNSATTVIRFEAVSVTGYRDMGLDYVRVMPPCVESPVAGSIDSVSPCLDEDFYLKLSGASQSSGMKFQWQRSVTGTNPWINMPGTENDIYKTQISGPTWFRAIVTCVASGKTDTTEARLVVPGPFYYCYCESEMNREKGINFFGQVAAHMGHNTANVTIVNQSGTDTVYIAGDTTLNTDFVTPYAKHYSYPKPKFNGYKDFRNELVPGNLYLDSSYQFIIHSVWASTVGNASMKFAAYIDYNQDGIYDTLTERIWIDLANNQDVRQVKNGVNGKPWSVFNFTVPDSAKVGITGMRVVRMGGSSGQVEWNAGPVPCGQYGDGQTVDYLVNIQNHPCDGPADAGLTTISDTLICPEYTVLVKNTSHATALSGIRWDWQSSTNTGNWNVVANSEGKDSIEHVFMNDISFRLRMICLNTNDTSYSNEVHVKNKGTDAPYKCYCYSIATGGNKDTSDIGSFKIGDYVFGGPGPQLNNPAAIHGRTDNTDTTLVLYTDSTYNIALSHILRSSTHADAKITIFIDYDNNLKYDANELVWEGTTTSTTRNQTAQIDIPSADIVATGVPTGMRVILNNNTDPNTASDEACGDYVSGETEDYVVIFRDGTSSIREAKASSIDARLYPNPSNGKVYLQYLGAAQSQVKVELTTITGQILRTKQANHVKNGTIIEMDLNEFAQGMYYIRLSTANEYVIRKVSLIK